jgi:adenylate cyclase
MAAPTVEERWRSALMGMPPDHLAIRRMFAHLPGQPRCKQCAAPFGGPGARIARSMGFKRWARNPTFCARCLPGIEERGVGGAEIELSFLFADIRGSTALAERMSASEFGRLLNRFYTAATDTLVRHDSMVDKFVGDEVVALFIPAFAGAAHAQRAVDAARELLNVTGHGSGLDPWVPLGVGVHTGVAYVGAVGAEGTVVDVTAVGDAVNTAARIAAEAGAGEVLVSDAAASGAGLDTQGLVRRRLDLKGKSQPVPVFVLTADDAERSTDASSVVR